MRSRSSIARLGPISSPIWQPWLQYTAARVARLGLKSDPIWQHCPEFQTSVIFDEIKKKNPDPNCIKKSDIEKISEMRRY